MSSRDSWLHAYRMCRTAASIEDRLAMKAPGYYLGQMRYKQRVLESGGYWPGFLLRASLFNCRCTAVPVVFHETQNGA